MSAEGLGSRAILGEMYMRLAMGAAGWVDELSFAVDSDQESETHKWLGMSPQMREWVGGRLVHGLREQGITITNVEFEATMEILLRELRRDKTGQIMARIADLAERANSHGAKLLSTLVINGESTVCYDGQFFFDTDHSEGDSGSQSNDISVDISALTVSQHGSTTEPSVDEMALVIMKLLQQMYGFKDDQGEPINETARKFLVMTPVALWGVAADAVSSANLSSGRTNPLSRLGMEIDVRPNPRLTWTEEIVGFRRDGVVKPFIKQEEVPLTVSAQAEGSPEEFNNKRHLYGVEWTGNYGYGMWQHACLATMTLRAPLKILLFRASSI